MYSYMYMYLLLHSDVAVNAVISVSLGEVGVGETPFPSLPLPPTLSLQGWAPQLSCIFAKTCVCVCVKVERA